MSITDQIRDAIRESGLTQAQIAAASGVSQRAISDLLRGRDVKTTSLDRLAIALGAELRLPKNFQKKIRKCIDSD